MRELRRFTLTTSCSTKSRCHSTVGSNLRVYLRWQDTCVYASVEIQSLCFLQNLPVVSYSRLFIQFYFITITWFIYKTEKWHIISNLFARERLFFCNKSHIIGHMMCNRRDRLCFSPWRARGVCWRCARRWVCPFRHWVLPFAHIIPTILSRSSSRSRVDAPFPSESNPESLYSQPSPLVFSPFYLLTPELFPSIS